MANVYPKEYLEKYEVLKESYYEKKKRDSRARQLRKLGYIVKVENVNWSWMDGSKVFYLTATRLKEECSYTCIDCGEVSNSEVCSSCLSKQVHTILKSEV